MPTASSLTGRDSHKCPARAEEVGDASDPTNEPVAARLSDIPPSQTSAPDNKIASTNDRWHNRHAQDEAERVTSLCSLPKWAVQSPTLKFQLPTTGMYSRPSTGGMFSKISLDYARTSTHRTPTCRDLAKYGFPFTPLCGTIPYDLWSLYHEGERK